MQIPVSSPWRDKRDTFENGRAFATEELAHWMLANGFATGHGDTMADLLKELRWQIDELRAKIRKE